MKNSTDREIRDYLNQVKRNVRHLPSARRDALLSELESHINEALTQRAQSRTPTQDDVRAVIAEMDPPDSFKQTADEAERGERRSSALAKLAFCVSLVGAIAAILIAALAASDVSHIVMLVSQAAAFIAGICGWRDPFGKAAVVMATAFLCIWAAVFAASSVPVLPKAAR
jgi:hypothetical protein